jgi:hypothetical protein
MRVNASKEFERNLYAPYLQQAGYTTGYPSPSLSLLYLDFKFYFQVILASISTI